MTRKKILRVIGGLLTVLVTLTIILSVNQQNPAFASNPGVTSPSQVEGASDNDARISLVSSSLDEIVLDVNIQGIEMSDEEVDGIVFDQIVLPHSGSTTEIGKPAVPTFGQFFAYPSGADVEVEILETSAQTIPDVFVHPAQEPLPDCASARENGEENVPFAFDADFYSQDITYPEQIVQVNDFSRIRGVATAVARFYPVQYNPHTMELTVYSHIKVRISFSGGNGVLSDVSKRAESFESLYANYLVNYDQLETVVFDRIQPENSPDVGAEFLIITHPDFFTAANTLATHRNGQGISTMVVTTTDTGSTAAAIQSYIQNAYDQWGTPPEFVLLLGDAEFIPTNYVTPHPFHDDELIGTDLYYATVDGTDYNADIHMGRISVDTLSEATNRINNIISYPAAGTHYDDVAVCAYFQDDDPRDGYEDRRFVLTNEEIRDYLLTQGYNVERIYTALAEVTPTNYNNGYYASGQPIPAELLRANGFAWDGDSTDITNAVNSGVFILNHRDHGAIWGWGDPYYRYTHVDALTNGSKQPIVFSINCGTGWFDNETDYNINTSSTTRIFSEAWERNANGGSVGIIAATRISFSGFNDYLTLGFYDAIWPDFLTFNDPSFDRPEYRMGAVLNYGKMAMQTLWPKSGGDTGTRITLEIIHYFGDPTMPIAIEEPPTNKVYLPLVIKGQSGTGGWEIIKDEDFEGIFPNEWSVNDYGSNPGEYYWGKRQNPCQVY